MLSSPKTQSADYRLLTRRCVSCGYDGALLRGGQARRCARCGCDLSLRPARSYAEMEGLLGQTKAIDDPRAAYAALRRRDEKLIHRWLAFLFMAMIGIIAIACLSAAAVSAV